MNPAIALQMILETARLKMNEEDARDEVKRVIARAVQELNSEGRFSTSLMAHKLEILAVEYQQDSKKAVA
jgi:hypothetical protein